MWMCVCVFIKAFWWAITKKVDQIKNLQKHATLPIKLSGILHPDFPGANP